MTSNLAAPRDPPSSQITSRPGRLVMVTGRLDEAGVGELRWRLRAAMEDDAAFVAVDLSAVSGCDERLFGVLADVHAELTARGGWMRLVGLSPAVLAALDAAPITQILLVYRISDCSPGRRDADAVIPA